MNMKLLNRINRIYKEIQLSGTTLIQKSGEVLADTSTGYANKADQLKITNHTRFGIASGCKIFTAVAICQLVEEAKLSFDTKLTDCLDISFPNFDKGITIHQLLTHTSGIPDYFDEKVMDDFEELWIQKPMYQIRRLHDFLPFFKNEKMKYKPGEHFHYNNAGYILLGLIVEQVSGTPFADYMEKYIFSKARMLDSGYFALDQLPKDTAIGYIKNPDGTFRTNMYSIPVQGGSDGGAFVTTKDMLQFWDALANYRLINKDLTTQLLTPHVQEDDNEYYGYGVWITKKEEALFKYHVMGYDPGVSFHSAYYPNQNITLAVCANISNGAFDVMDGSEEELLT
ncbi:serine hydrolase [Ornithinibacillus sp. L9]|uniref:Serine hydrolase n=1 Tax=Ornithinibacillus caprae TaxID=2678566 RepID=A0A6N8FBF2_9BACI|nr:serine hydrolase [Ornithinibacillus caprae]MUK86883.1 serine hydrolase [Ornithinibacillus caprae]